MRKTGESRVCPICKKVYHVPQWKINNGIGKRCSVKCYGKSKIGKPPWNKGKKGLIKKNDGTFTRSEIKWKGTISEYKSLHYWVYKYLGRPNECEYCGIINPGKKKLHWANRSGEYKKDISDWIRLCARCHYNFDKTYERRQKNQK